MLSEKAMIIVVSISSTTMKITDKQAGAELTARKRATEKSARVVKNLINPDHLKEIAAVQTAFRTYIQANTVPWIGDTFLLPKDKYYEFVDKLLETREELDKEVDKFIRKYAELIQESHETLGELFDASAYPDVFDLRQKFQISVQFMPVPDVNQFNQLGLESETEAELKAEALQAQNNLLQDATESLYKRVHHRVELLHNRLVDAETKRYRSSLIEGLEFLVETMPSLNITGEPFLTGIMDDIQRMLAGFTLDEVRESDCSKEEL